MIGIIILIIYFLGIFLTPIIVKKCFSDFVEQDSCKSELPMVLCGMSVIWPAILILYGMNNIGTLFLWIYNKV